jgi:predicted PurR-regulated permease PerM
LRIIAIVGAILLLLWLLADVLLLVFLAILIAAILRALARWTSRKTHLPQHVALACVTLVLITILGVLLYYLGPLLIVQGEAMWQSVLHQIDAIRSTDGRTDWAQWILERFSAWTAVGGPLATSARSFITLTSSGLIEVLVMCVTALYFAIDPELYVGGVVRLLPQNYRVRGREILLDAGRALVLWSAGQFVDMVVVGVMVAIGFSVLHLPLAFGLAVLAGLLTFVPVLGAIFAAIPALVVGLAAGWHTAVWVIAVFLCCHIVEAYIVGPAVQRRTVRLPPALTILSMTCLGSIFGLLGVVLGAPLAAVLLVIIREAYVGDVLGDPAG